MKAKNKARFPSGAKRTVRDYFQQFARVTSDIVGSAWAFLIAILIVLLWLASGPMFGYSDTWQLIINTGTTVVTFMMVFLIQSTQNRDAKAMHLKLDELLRATNRASNELVDLEDLSEHQLDALAAHFARLHQEAMAARKKGGKKAAGQAGPAAGSRGASGRKPK